MSDISAAAAVQPTQNLATAPSPPTHGQKLWSHGSFGFKDLLDIINPLQHLPIIGSVYRYLTGDEPSGGARIVGDAIYGGPIGFGVGVVSTMLTDDDGHDLGERALASVFGPRGDGAAPTAVAQASSNAPSTPPQPALASPASTQAPPPGGPVQLARELYRSPSATTPPTPEQNFLAQNAQLQRQLTGSRPDTGQVLNNRPVPLQLTGNPLANIHPIPPVPARPGGSALALPAGTTQPTDPPVANPIAQKMLDALDKYERLKKQQNQYDGARDKAPSGVDLSL